MAKQETVGCKLDLESVFYLQKLVEAREDLATMSDLVREALAPKIDEGREIVRKSLETAAA